MKSKSAGRTVGFALLVAATVAQAHEFPYPPSQTYRITQGNNAGSHTGLGSFAYDFGMAVGSVVSASEDGIVSAVRQDSDLHGCDDDYANSANYIVVDHGDGMSSLYLHLQRNSALVQPGQRVVRGQALANVGLSGWVCGAHLHYQVQNRCAGWYCESVRIMFAPRLAYPANGTISASRAVNFQWGSVPGATIYRIVISQRADFAGYDDATRTCDNTCFTATTNQTNYIRTMTNGNYVYHVQLRASDAATVSSVFSRSSFRTP
jgi:murein DD-endopeptidase MepM/ murein hydrolase activator NlpD